MPRDIRSYFAPVATSRKNSEPVTAKSQKRRIISSSSDEDEKKPQSSTKRSTVVKRKKSSILSDSEDEERFVRDDKKDSSDFTANKKSKSKESCKAIPLTELFGKKPIMRVEEAKVNRKLQKVESEFHDDKNFDAVLKQLDVVHDTLIQDKQKSKSNIKNMNSPKKLEAAVKTEVVSNKNRKYNNSLKDCDNKTNDTSEQKCEDVKQSPNKNNVYSKVINSSPKQNLQKEKKGSLNGDLDISNKDTEKSLSRKKAKIMEENLFEERKEMKKQRATMYEKYLQRGGARNPGSKETPTGAENCLAGVSFLITGVLDSLERNEVEDLIQKYGGRTVNSVSKKVNYIIVGDEAGPSKLAKAINLGIKQISEDDLLEMIRTRPEGKTADIKSTKAKSNVKKIFRKFESDESLLPNKTKALLDSPKKIKTPPSLPVKTSVNTKTSPASKQTLDASNDTQKVNIITSIGSEPLVERYRPKTMKQIIGQQGDKSCAHNLYIWLRDWYQNRQNSKFKDSTSKQTHGQNFKAALLSGPPGVGKTTTVQVICKELGYDLVEFNASDTRNKTLLKEAVSGLLSNTTMKDYVTGTKQKITSKHVLLMDEVDGMAGNEDRGGLQELVNLIKHTDVPVICICNDRFNTKVKTISTHSYDLKYPKLRVEQIRSSMKSLCFKENIKISTEDLDRLIESTNYDIRQVINHLEFLGTQMTHVKTIDKKHSNKNFKLGPFDITKIAFNANEQKSMSLNDKIGLYFHDYNIAPLFIQENYQGVRLSQISPRQRLERIANAADSISQGDLVEKVMRSNMMWSLLPLHACFSFVIPASEMSGSSDGLIRFPSWFGRNSKTTRFNRLLQELTTHTRLATSANKDALNMDYLPYIRNAIVKPLIDNGVDGIEEAINIMRKYHLTREDLDSAIEISLWPGMSDSTSNLDSKIKAAFTRAYQKNPPMLPYAINSTTTTKKRSRQNNDVMGEEEDGEEEETDDIDFDKMIKAKKPTVASTSKAALSTRKRGESAKKCGKVRGKGK
ncbi:PREDICTED: replication factor C subunit 1 isoform X2 [Trachymyrmex cornetzi]|uniref:replication factor C subunit 1 isoform X2 n=1 Tax=Trachymyrmex cornetzi TaxID=471704 RepID=UPI00084F3438|nr:PREDICTED: replication factor C subunit 1 isoform X2 [Trachymyrmex cornetzi]